MRLFMCAMVAVLGIGMFAVAALAWDRRRDLLLLVGGGPASADRRAEDGSDAGAASQTASKAAGVVSAVVGSDKRYVPHAVVFGSMILGMAMLIGSCAGLLRF